MGWDDYANSACQGDTLAVATQLSDSEDVMTNLPAQLSTIQTDCSLVLLKMAMGFNAYNGFREQMKLLEQMEKVGSGHVL